MSNPGNRKRPAANQALSKVTHTTATASRLHDRIDRFLHDLLLDVMLDGERRYWLKRAEDFERAKPRPEEFHGRADAAELRAQWLRLDEIARACRARAEVSHVDDIREDVANVLAEFEPGRLREVA